MHQHPILTNIVSMAVLNLKVVNKYRLSQFLNLNIGNLNLVTVSGNKCITDFKIACGNPTLIFNIERVVRSGVNSFAVRSGNVQYLVSFFDPDVQNLFKLCFSCFIVVGENLITDGYFFNANLLIFNQPITNLNGYVST